MIDALTGHAIATLADAAGADPASIIGTTVTPVVVVLLLVTGWLRTKGETDRVTRDLAEERAARVELQRVLTSEVVPALTRSTDAVTRSTDLMESMARRQSGGV